MNVKGEDGKHNHYHPESDPAHTPAMKSELITVCEETQDMINGLRLAINTHAEIMGLHRYLLEKFIPPQLLEKAVCEYAETRRAQIEEERLIEQAKETSSGQAS